MQGQILNKPKNLLYVCMYFISTFGCCEQGDECIEVLHQCNLDILSNIINKSCAHNGLKINSSILFILGYTIKRILSLWM